MLADLTSLLTTSRQTGVHLPNLQPSAGQFFASLDPINEASAILGPLNTNPRSSVQHQFQDTFPGTSHTFSNLPWHRALRPEAAHSAQALSSWRGLMGTFERPGYTFSSEVQILGESRAARGGGRAS